jgi:hypothetical protein
MAKGVFLRHGGKLTADFFSGSLDTILYHNLSIHPFFQIFVPTNMLWFLKLTLFMLGHLTRFIIV